MIIDPRSPGRDRTPEFHCLPWLQACLSFLSCDSATVASDFTCGDASPVFSGADLSSPSAWAAGRITSYNVCDTYLLRKAGSTDLPLCVVWENRPRQHVYYERGRRALTHWECLRVEADRSLMRLIPYTGRSHQLRVHMLELGHPILGDHLYAPPEAQLIVPHLQLHAAMLRINHPVTGQRLTFEAPAPFPL